MWWEVGLIQFIEDLSVTRRLSQRDFCYVSALTRTQSFLAFGLGLKCWTLFGLERASFQNGTHITASPVCQTFRLRLQLHICSPRYLTCLLKSCESTPMFVQTNYLCASLFFPLSGCILLVQLFQRILLLLATLHTFTYAQLECSLHDWFCKHSLSFHLCPILGILTHPQILENINTIRTQMSPITPQYFLCFSPINKIYPSETVSNHWTGLLAVLPFLECYANVTFDCITFWSFYFFSLTIIL